MDEMYEREITHRDEDLVQLMNKIREKTIREIQTSRESYEAGARSTEGKGANDELAYLRAQVAHLSHYKRTIAPLERLAEIELAMIQNQHNATKLDLALLPRGRKEGEELRKLYTPTAEDVLKYMREIPETDLMELSKDLLEVMRERGVEITPTENYCKEYLSKLSKEELKSLVDKMIEKPESEEKPSIENYCKEYLSKLSKEELKSLVDKMIEKPESEEKPKGTERDQQ